MDYLETHPTAEARIISSIHANQERFLLNSGRPADDNANQGNALILQLANTVDCSLLQQCAQSLVDQHSILRTRFERGDDGFQAAVEPNLSDWFDYENSESALTDEVIDRLRHSIGRAFDLEHGPLFRVAVVACTDEQNVLAFNAHPSIVDAASLRLLFNELVHRYNALCRGESCQSIINDNSPIEDYLDADAIASDLEYWNTHLADSPTTQGIPPTIAEHGSTVKGPIDTIECQCPLTFASDDGLASCAAAVSLLISRFTGMSDTVVALHCDGRATGQIPPATIGQCSNTLFLRSNGCATDSVEAFTSQMSATIIAATNHARVPLNQIVQETGMQTTVEVDWQSSSQFERFDGMQSGYVRHPASWISACPISICFSPTDDDGLCIRMQFDGAKYDRSRMQIVLGQLSHVLKSVTSQPTALLQSIEIRTADERSVLPDPFSPQEPLQSELLLTQFQQRVIESPDAIAVESEAGTVTYDVLDRMSNQLAQLLQLETEGQTNAPIAIVASRNCGLLFSLLAVLKCGRPFLIVDSEYPDHRIEEYLQQVQPCALLLSGAVSPSPELQSTFDELPNVMAIPEDLDELQRLVEGYSDETISLDVAVNATAYLSFTSGSTGKPKCIRTPHAPLPHFIKWQQRTFDLTSSDRFSMLSGLGHDPVLRDIFTPLSIGATLCIPKQETILDPSGLCEWFCKQRISICHLTPPLGQIIVTGNDERPPLDSLRYMFWGGDRLTGEGLQSFAAVCPKARHVNFYGTTETPQAMSFFIIDDAAKSQSAIPIGQGIDDVQLVLITPTGQPAAVGELAEICIRTRYLSNGYDHDADETAKRFITSPFTQDSSDVLYRTGDQARYLHDGNVVFVGRQDDQVKIRGYRVELGEVAATVRSQECIQDCLVQHRKTNAGSDQLIAYYIAENSQSSIEPAEIMEELRPVLPTYMLPTFLVRMDAWPLSPNGKINRKLLPEPTPDDIPVSSMQEEAATPREHELKELWQEVLGLPNIGVNEDFFSLGGDSLTAIRIIFKMTRLGIDERICRGLFQGRSIREIAHMDDPDSGIAPTTKADTAPKAFLDGSDTANLTLVVNLVRGLLVVLLVIGHWSEAVIQRLPDGVQDLIRQSTMPIFNFATPGFATMFGLSMGFIFYPRYLKDPKGVSRILRTGVLLLLASVFILATAKLTMKVVEYKSVSAITSLDIANSLYSVLTYYLLGILTVPLWFRVAKGFRNPVIGAGVLSLTLYGAYMVVAWYLQDVHFQNIYQLGKLMAAAKFNYFAMGAGSVMGLAMGIHLYKQIDHPHLSRLYARMGIILLVVGLILGLYFGTKADWLAGSKHMLYWKWIFYGGVVCGLIAIFHSVVQRFAQFPPIARSAIRWSGVIGQLALPMFLLHHFVKDLKDILDLTPLPGVVNLAAVLTLFCILSFLMMRKIYNLYYGSLHA